MKNVEKFYRRGICDEKATSGTTRCCKCKWFVHLKCTNTTYNIAKELGDQFVCLKCEVSNHCFQIYFSDFCLQKQAVKTV